MVWLQTAGEVLSAACLIHTYSHLIVVLELL